ncbi:MAG: hypothetical protein OXN88_10300 [Chloroflexota bacterium]|nr:hypothetical protein [Chloroflexota bacterium]
MTGEQLDVLDSAMGEIVTRAEKYPIHLQPTILKILWAEVYGAPSITVAKRDQEFHPRISNGSGPVSPAEGLPDWDFRRGLDQIAEQHDYDLKSPYDYEYALIVSHVLQFLSPSKFDATLTTDLVNDAWRHADRNLPSSSRRPLNKAAEKGLLERAKGSPGYVLTPKGENCVKKLLANGDLS